ncbi:MAG: DUF1983 domain-containing protein [Methylomicrobium sp.]|nr:DUF1983 domain-containing protein [Methylomicrobium sp.]
MSVSQVVGSGGGCFRKGTQIQLEHGKTIAIDKLKKGDEILAFDEAGDIHVAKVIKVHVHREPQPILKVRFWRGEIFITPNHWVLNQFCSFVEMSTLSVDDALVDSMGHLRPIIEMEHVGFEEVYNLTVEPHHTFIADGIRVHNGGHRERYPEVKGAGGGSKSTGGRIAVEARDTLRSHAQVSLIDLLGEGEIGGLVDGAKSIFLDDTPLMSAVGGYNFTNVEWDFRPGTPNQSIIPNFSDVGSPVVASHALTTSAPYTFTVSNPNVDRVRIVMNILSLMRQDPATGDINGAQVRYQFAISVDGGPMLTVGEDIVIKGKTRSKYQRAHLVDLPKPGSTWTIQVRRMTTDSTSSALSNATQVDSYVEITDVKLNYPSSVLVSMAFDPESFSRIPRRSYLVDGAYIQVPSNYNPITRAYSGTWDGTFKVAVSNNPAWWLYELLINKRAGLGDYISPNQVNKAKLYTIGKYCDELVDNGYGSFEPRFTINTSIQTRAEAYKLISDIASVFRGMTFWGGEMVDFTNDAPSSTTGMVFSQANVVDGLFNYTGSSRKDRHSVVLVTWNDPAANYKQRVAYVEDAELIKKLGYKKLETIAFGCTSEAQAIRAGRWILYTEQYESNMITFKVGMDAALVMPGEVVKIHDSLRAGKRMSGRIKSATANSVTLDAPVTLDTSSATVSVRLPDGTFVDRQVNQGAGDHSVLTWSTALSIIPSPMAMFIVSETTLVPMLARVINVKPGDGDQKYTYEISCVEHNPTKYTAVESDLLIEQPQTSVIDPFNDNPTNISIDESTYFIAPGVIGSKLHVSWEGKAKYFEVSYRTTIDDQTSNWHIETTAVPSYEILGLMSGSIVDIKIIAISSKDVRSLPLDAAHAILGKTAPPSPPTNLTAQSQGSRSILLRWINPPDIDFDHVEIYMSTPQEPLNPEDPLSVQAAIDAADDSSLAVRIARTSGDTFLVTELPSKAVTRFFWVKAIDTSSNKSQFNAIPGTSASTEAEADYMVALLENKIDSSTLSQELAERIDGAGDLGIQVDAQQGVIDGVLGKYTVKIDHNGYVSGYGLMSEENDGAVISEFAVRADRFSIGGPSGSASELATPFMVLSAPTVIDGTMFDPGVYMNSAMITKLTASQIDTTGITIRDDSGKVILSSDVPLDYDTRVTNKPEMLSFHDTFQAGLSSSWFESPDSIKNGVYGMQDAIDALSGGRVLRIGDNSGNNMVWFVNSQKLAFDPTALYQIKCRVRRLAGSGSVYVGLVGVAADGVTLVNSNGANSLADQHFVVAAGANPESSWVEYVGYVKGVALQGTSVAAPSIESPGVLHQNVKFIRPVLIANYNNQPGITEFDVFSMTQITADLSTGASVRYIYSENEAPPVLPPSNQTTGWDITPSEFTIWATLQINTTSPSGVITEYGAWGQPVKIKGRAGSDGSNGKSPLSVIISNEAHTLSSDSSGNVGSYVGSGTTIQVYEGVTALTGLTTLVNGSFNIGTPIVSPSGAIVVGNRTYSGIKATVAQHSGMTSDTVTITYPVNIRRLDGTSVTLSKTQTLSKGKAGIAGADAQYVLISGDQSFKYLKDSSAPTSPTVVLAATLFGGLSGYQWQYWNGNAWSNISGATSASYTLAHDADIWSGSKLRIRCISGGLFDEITIVKLFDGATGSSAHSGYLTNESHALPTSHDGSAYNLSNAGGVFKVFEGSREVTAAFEIEGGNLSGSNYLKSQNGLVLDVDRFSGLYSLSGGSWVSDNETFTLKAVSSGADNRLVYPQQIGKAPWFKLRVSTTQNATAAPDDTMTGVKLASSEDGYRAVEMVYIPAGTTYAYSIYAKKDEFRVLWVVAPLSDGTTTTHKYGRFDLESGIATNVFEATDVLVGMDYIVNGWYRCWMIIDIDVSITLARFRIELRDNMSSLDYPNDGVSGLYIWGAQLTKGDKLLPYIPETTITKTYTIAKAKEGDIGPQGVKGNDGSSTYTWIRYADNSSGSGISNSPTGRTYIGLAHNKTTPIESNTPSDYTWSLIKGTDGVAGPAGADGQTTYTWIKYADVADGTGLYDVPTSNTEYIGIAVNKTTPTESSNKLDYVWSKFRGGSGADAQYVLISGDQSFKYLKDSPTPINTSTVLTATLFGGLSGYQWQYWNGSVWSNIPGAISPSYTLAHDADIWSGSKLRIRCISGGLFDEITIVKLFDGATGSSAHSGYLTNESHALPTSHDGSAYNLSNAGGVFKVFEGSREVTAAFEIEGGNLSGSNYLKSQNGLVLDVDRFSGLYSLSGGSWVSDNETFTLKAVSSGADNRLVYPQQIGKAPWFKLRVSTTQNATAAPDDTMTGVKLASSEDGYRAVEMVYIPAGTTYAYSIYAKKDEFRVLWVVAPLSDGTTTTHKYGRFDLESGIATNVFEATDVLVGMDYIVNGWYRCWMIIDIDVSITLARFRIELRDNMSSLDYPNDGVSGLYIWGAQLTKGDKLLPYIPETTITKTYTIAKAKEGDVGENSRTVSLSASTLAFTYNSSGTSPSPTSTVVTATAINTTGTPYYRFLLNGSQVQHTTSNTYTYTPQSSHANMPQTITVELREGSTGGAVLDTDTISMIGVRPGVNGPSGYNTAVVYLYRRSTATPAKTGSTLTYTFSSSSWSASFNNGWVTSIPTGTAPLWVMVTTVTSQNSSVSVPATSWSDPVKLVENGINGQDGLAGLNTATAYLYRKSTSGTSAPASFSGTFTYTFSTGLLSGGTFNTWAQSPPTLNKGEFLWMRQATASSTSSTDTISISEWSSAAVIGIGGQDGTDGQGQVKALAFRRAATAPSTPTGGSLNSPVPTTAGWSGGVPAGTDPVWVATRVFTSDGQAPQQSAWTTPILFVQNGESANTGPNLLKNPDLDNAIHGTTTCPGWSMATSDAAGVISDARFISVPTSSFPVPWDKDQFMFRVITSGTNSQSYAQLATQDFISIDTSKPHTLSAWMLALFSGNTAQFFLECRDTNLNILGWIDGAFITAPGVWARYTKTFEPSDFLAGTKYVKPLFRPNRATDSAVGEVRLTRASLHEGSIANNNVTPFDKTNVNSTNIIKPSNVSIYIANAAIDTAQIANAAINTAKIADAAITSAKIGNAQVDTLQIAGNAVTVPVSVKENTMLGINVGLRDLLSLQITVPANTNITIVGHALFNNVGLLNNAMHRIGAGFLILFRDGNEIATNSPMENDMSVSHTIVVVDSPTSGTHLYELKYRSIFANKNFATSAGNCSARSLIAIGSKR